MFTEDDQKSFKRILVINTAFIGDVILTSPLINALRKNFPESSIDFLLIPETKNVYERDIRIDKVIVFDKRKIIARVIHFFSVIKQLRRNRYDLAVSVQSSLTSSLLMIMGNIKERVGFPRQNLLTRSVKHVPGLHMRERILRLMNAFTEEKFSTDTELYIPESDLLHVKNIIGEQKSKFIIAIAPGSAKFTKQWLEEYFIELCKLLKDINATIYLIGGKTDYGLSERIKKGSENKKVFNLCGKVTIIQSAALIKSADILLSNDSAPLHLANAVKTKVLAIFGPTIKSLGFYPYREDDKILEVELDCRPCGKHGGSACPLGHFNCMKNLTPDYVYKEIISGLNAKQ